MTALNKATDLATNRKAAGIALGENWARFAELFLIDVFEKMCNGNPPGPRFALSVTGSLARKQATQYSDLEFFFVVETPEDVVPFVQLADQMWDVLGSINKATGAFTADAHFKPGWRYNTLTTTCKGIYFDPDSLQVKFDCGLLDYLEFKDAQTVHYEMAAGARCIAGDQSLLADLKLNIRTDSGLERLVFQFRDRLTGILKPGFNEVKKELEQRKRTVNVDIKQAILRTLLWVTIDLGRCYNVHGIGDFTHMTELKRNQCISLEVYLKMVKALSYAQIARFGAHQKAGKEHDEVQLTPELKSCLRTASALVEMADVWTRQQRTRLGKTQATATRAEMSRDCFMTKHPQRYDYFKVGDLLQ